MNKQDSFSEPDPAPVDPEGLITEQGAALDMIDPAVDCRNCIHYEVCTVIAGIRPMFENWSAGGPEDEPPVDPTDLAVICEAFETAEDGWRPEME